MTDLSDDRFSVRYMERVDMPEWLSGCLPDTVERLPVGCSSDFSPRQYLLYSAVGLPGALALASLAASLMATDHTGGSGPEILSGAALTAAQALSAILYDGIGIALLMGSLFCAFTTLSFAWRAAKLVVTTDDPIGLTEARGLADLLEDMTARGIAISPVVRRKLAMIEGCGDLRMRDLQWITQSLDADLKNHFAILYDRSRRMQENERRREAEWVSERLRVAGHQAGRRVPGCMRETV